MDCALKLESLALKGPRHLSFILHNELGTTLLARSADENNLRITEFTASSFSYGQSRRYIILSGQRETRDIFLQVSADVTQKRGKVYHLMLQGLMSEWRHVNGSGSSFTQVQQTSQLLVFSTTSTRNRRLSSF